MLLTVSCACDLLLRVKQCVRPSSPAEKEGGDLSKCAQVSGRSSCFVGGGGVKRGKACARLPVTPGVSPLPRPNPDTETGCWTEHTRWTASCACCCSRPASAPSHTASGGTSRLSSAAKGACGSRRRQPPCRPRAVNPAVLPRLTPCRRAPAAPDRHGNSGIQLRQGWHNL